MVREHLSEELKIAGGQLLAITDGLEMQAQGAMWLYDHQLQDWRYYLVTSLVDTIGRRRTYRLLLDALETVVFPGDMTIEDVHLGSPADDLFRIVSRAARIDGAMAEFQNCVFGAHCFDGVLYRSVNEIPTMQQAQRIERCFVRRVRGVPGDDREARKIRAQAGV
jgi:hypothetical protein